MSGRRDLRVYDGKFSRRRWSGKRGSVQAESDYVDPNLKREGGRRMVCASRRSRNAKSQLAGCGGVAPVFHVRELPIVQVGVRRESCEVPFIFRRLIHGHPEVVLV